MGEQKGGTGRPTQVLLQREIMKAWTQVEVGRSSQLLDICIQCKEKEESRVISSFGSGGWKNKVTLTQEGEGQELVEGDAGQQLFGPCEVQYVA